MVWDYLVAVALFATWLMMYQIAKQVDYVKVKCDDLTNIVRSIKYNYMRDESERQKKE